MILASEDKFDLSFEPSDLCYSDMCMHITVTVICVCIFALAVFSMAFKATAAQRTSEVMYDHIFELHDLSNVCHYASMASNRHHNMSLRRVI